VSGTGAPYPRPGTVGRAAPQVALSDYQGMQENRHFPRKTGIPRVLPMEICTSPWLDCHGEVQKADIPW